MSNIRMLLSTRIFTVVTLLSLVLYLEWTMHRLNGHLRQIQKNSGLAENPSTAGTPGIITSATLFAISIRLFRSAISVVYFDAYMLAIIMVITILKLI